VASQARQIKIISVTKTIAEMKSGDCHSAIRPLSAIVRRFCYMSRVGTDAEHIAQMIAECT
jgi:hypothetical protein